MEAFEMDLATEGQSLYTSIDIRHPRSRALLRSPTRTSRSASAGMGFLRYQKEGSCRDLVADPGKTVGFGTCITHSFVQVFSLAQGPSQRFHRTERVRTIPAEAQDEAGRPHPCEPPCEHQRGFRRALRMDMATVRQPVLAADATLDGSLVGLSTSEGPFLSSDREVSSTSSNSWGSSDASQCTFFCGCGGGVEV